MLRTEIQEVLACKNLSKTGITRLNHHFAAIRDIEGKTAPASTASLGDLEDDSSFTIG